MDELTQTFEFIFIAATDGGIIGFDTTNGSWLRMIGRDGNRPDGFDGFSCLDILLLKRGARPEQPCRAEDIYFVDGDEPCVVGRAGLSGLARLRSCLPDGKIFGNTVKTVNANDAEKLKSVYALVYVTDFVVDISATLEATECRCAFTCNEREYFGFALSDPALCGVEHDGEGSVHAFVVIGLDDDPEKEGRFIKKVLKVIPLPPAYSVNNVYGEGAERVINFYKEGYFYSVFDDDAEALHTLFGYKLIAGKRAKTGIPVAGARRVASSLAGHNVVAVFRDAEGREVDLSLERKTALKPKLVPAGLKSDGNGNLVDGDGVVYDAKEKAKEVKDRCVEVKEFFDAVLAGVNPVTGRAIAQGDFARSAEMAENLKFAVDILVQVSGRKGRKRKAPKCKFYLTDEAMAAYKPYETPVSLTLVINRINEVSDGEKMLKLTYAEVFAALVERGYMREERDGAGKVSRVPTDEGIKRGIIQEKRISQYNTEYKVVLYGEEGQKFILGLVREICG